MAHTAPLLPGRHYHVFNRGNNRETLFRERQNYAYFLTLYAAHVGPVAETLAFCLLPNHFHLLVRIRPDLASAILPSRAFSNLFNAYARSFNRAYGRTGALFQRPFQRILVGTEGYYTQLLVYIHQNPQRHGLINDFREWPYSSYHALTGDQPTWLSRSDVLAWFGGDVGLAAAHTTIEDLSGVAPD